MSRMASDHAISRTAGFTLIEVLVAFVIAALALAVFYEGAIGALTNAHVAGLYEEALSLAKSHMAELTARNAARPVSADGTDGKLFRYQVKVTALASQTLPRTLLEEANNRPARVATLFGVEVTESWGKPRHERSVHLLTEAIGNQTGAQ